MATNSLATATSAAATPSASITWAKCDAAGCGKWRKLGAVDPESLPLVWTCATAGIECSTPEEQDDSSSCCSSGVCDTDDESVSLGEYDSSSDSQDSDSGSDMEDFIVDDDAIDNDDD